MDQCNWESWERWQNAGDRLTSLYAVAPVCRGEGAGANVLVYQCSKHEVWIMTEKTPWIRAAEMKSLHMAASLRDKVKSSYLFNQLFI